MQKKSHLLSNLKRQVVALKNQLQKFEKNKQSKYHKQSFHSRNSRSPLTQSPRFESRSYDSSYLDKGIKKFYHQPYQFKNLAEVIKEKSAIPKIPTFSCQRKLQNEKTRSNFSSDRHRESISRSRSPNPITGEGYVNKNCGVRTAFQKRREKVSRASGRRHFSIFV